MNRDEHGLASRGAAHDISRITSQYQQFDPRFAVGADHKFLLKGRHNGNDTAAVACDGNGIAAFDGNPSHECEQVGLHVIGAMRSSDDDNVRRIDGQKV